MSYISKIDSKRFGFKIARIDFLEFPTVGLIPELKEAGIKMIISRIECEKLGLINQLEELKFKTMDFQVTYKYKIKNSYLTKEMIDSEFSIREAKKEDTLILKEIAEESFDQYGHYFADKKLDQSNCREIYKDWIERSIEERDVSDIVFIAEKGNEIAGFLSFKIKKDDFHFAAGVQGAVAKRFRNQNVFRVLAQGGLKWGSDLNLDWEEHNVLLTNYSVNRSLIRIGFIPCKSFVTMHCWLE